MEHKKILCCFISTLLFGLFIVPVMAGESSTLTKDGLYSVGVSCVDTSSYHTINSRNGATYPFGKAYCYTTIGGVPQKEKEIMGQSQATYWSASYYTKSAYEKITSASTVAYGVSVRAASH